MNPSGPRTELKLGDWVEVSQVWERESNWSVTPMTRQWVAAVLVKPQFGIYTGYRTLYSGVIRERSHENPAYLEIKDHHTCYLVVMNERRKPLQAAIVKKVEQTDEGLEE